MKQTKWQRLATIGLCSSLVINAFSGATAVAEESSPTVASSAKEATSASSATPESTESSQETTETSREAETKGAEEQAEAEVPTETPEVRTDTTEQPAEKSSESDRQKNISPRWVPNNQVIYPRMTFAFTDETGKAFADENLTLSGTYYKLARHAATSQWRPYATRYPIVSSNAGGGQYRVAVNAAVPMPYDFLTNLPAGYAVNMYAIEQLKIDNTLKYVDSIVAPVGTIRRTYYSDQQVSEIPQFGNYGSANLTQRDRTFSKNSANIFSLNSVALAPSINDVLTMMSTDGTVSALGRDIILVGFDGTSTYRQTMNYKVTRKQVTEKFVDTNGVAITPPTGFTQNKKTPMTSNNYTFKQAGTLPDTYQADGKTYKFKGWYKGKTKTNTLTTTKAPSYAVTYDDNDDLNVVYEEVVPRDTWVYPGFYAEFVDEQGKAFTNPLTFSGNYTQFLRKKIVNIFETTGNLYPMIGSKDPSQSNKYKIETQSRIPISATYDGNVTGDVYDKREYGLHDLTITNELKYVDKIEVMNTSLQAADYLVGYVGIDPILIDFPNILHPLERAFIKNTNQRFSINAIFGANGSASTIPRLLRIGGKDQPNQRNVTLMGFDGTTNYKHTMNYKVTRKQVTENFVDTNGTKITPPTGFTQNKKTPMTSNNYTFKQAGTLPDTYTTGGKTYKFKGWYKGKTKPNTLTTTKAPSYAVTYDDNDDLNVVYEEETVTTLYPSINMNFVNEKGGTFTPALTFSGKYYAQSTSASLRTDLYDVTSKNNGSGQYTVSINNGSMPLSQELLKKYNNGQPISATNRLRFNVDKLTINQQLKYVDTIQVDTAQSSSLNYYGHKYTSGSSTIFDPNIAPTEYNMTTEQINSLNFSSDGTYFSNANNRFFNMHLGYSSSGGSSLLMMALFNENPVNQTKLVYKVTRKQVTETFVNTNGTKITPPTGFTQGNKIPMTSNTFKYTAAKALPATYTAGGKTYTFQGWYKGKTKPNALTTSTTPTYNTTFDGNDDMTAMYKEEVPKASVALTRTTAETVTSGGNVTWRATITNTSQAPLTTATIKKSTAWTTGLAAPTAMIVTPAGGTAKTVPVTATTWTNGVSLGTDIPVGKSATVQFTTKATGTAGQVLRAGITTSGNYSGVSTSATVRVKDNDQAIVTPTAEGFISVPTFNFGQVDVASATKQHGLKKAADYYGNGTRNPYLRIKKTQPNWSLTAQLSQPKSATDSLPTATRLLLGAAPVSSFSNYNQPTELKNAVGTTSAISLNANNTATRIIANQQFTGSNIYQLDFTFNNVKLEVPANQGVKGQQYQAAVTWNLVTGP
ncbi:WxL domain-containing protein [Enterococcus faecalis]|uniref:WxL domain-containing protein n=1 Tax=Enterococcus faecalis TaxID=1351 RepID=UPI00115B7567|nr:WxL domain-containing protein [Enterococcus faecalis]EGO8089231.1 WxL domain-containing protein [Enterococcus faecalis]EGO8234897.1 WxL domain-containing protein [Enterococcus faecalis]EGO8501780.1 WxL domain-containing protein [Enterococcus faecalis]MCD5082509.1 WxL domain-containing protein [Enterococcus faecalis]MDK4447283.1 WxL domain-containing protein [Enterococcus faecalis]